MTIDDPTVKARAAAGVAEATGKLERTAEAPAQRRAHGGWLKRHRRLGLIAGAAILAGSAFLLFVAPKLLGDGGHKYVTATVTRGDIENTVTAVGNVQPKNYVDVGAQVSGQIKTLKVNIGDKVKKGDLLAEIDAQVQAARVESDKDNLTSLQAQLVQQQAQLVLKKAQYERQVRLDKDNATSKDNLQSAKAAYDSQVAQIDVLQAQINQAQSSLHADQVTLSYATIVAPMDGTVVSLPARLGQTLISIQQAPTILRIADLSLMQILTQVSEADVAKLKVGMPAYFTTLGNPDRRYTSTLEQIQPTPETVNNVILYDVLSDVPNTDGSLMTQMTAQSFFVTASAKNVLMVPVAAVQPLSGARQGGGGFRPGAAAPGSFGGQRPGGFGTAGGQGMQVPPGAGAGFAPPQGAGGGVGEATGQGRKPGGHGVFAAHHGFAQVMDESGKIERRMVETGVTDRVNIEIKSGLKEGDKVVVGEAQKVTKPAGAAATGRPPFGFAP
jgi:macrolide-specific efflux system membrane fusion protein